MMKPVGESRRDLNSLITHLLFTFYLCGISLWPGLSVGRWVSWLVGCSVGRFVDHNFLKVQNFHFCAPLGALALYTYIFLGLLWVALSGKTSAVWNLWLAPGQASPHNPMPIENYLVRPQLNDKYNFSVCTIQNAPFCLLTLPFVILTMMLSNFLEP